MEPFKVISFILLPVLAVASVVPSVRLTSQEEQHVIGDPKVTQVITFDMRAYKSDEEFEDLGQLKFGLFGENLPITVNAFVTLSQMSVGGYNNSVIHRIAKDIMIQGGQYGRKGFQDHALQTFDKFKTESFEVMHTKKGRISLASTPGNTNSCSFFVTLKVASIFDAKYVCFGQLIDGFSVLKKINEIPLDDDKPKWDVVVHNVVVAGPEVPSSQVYIDLVQGNYSFFIFGCVALTVVLLAYRYRNRIGGSASKVVKI